MFLTLSHVGKPNRSCSKLCSKNRAVKMGNRVAKKGNRVVKMGAMLFSMRFCLRWFLIAAKRSRFNHQHSDRQKGERLVVEWVGGWDGWMGGLRNRGGAKVDSIFR